MVKTFRMVAVSAVVLGLVACSSSSGSSSHKSPDAGLRKDSAATEDGATTDGEAKKDAGKSKDAAKGWDAPAPTTVAAFCTDQLGVEAEHLSVCTGGPAAAWYTNLTANNACTKLEAAVTAGRVKFDASQTHACLEAYAKFTCADGDDQGQPSECKAVLAGTVAANGTCYADVDCSGTDYCAGIDEAAGDCGGKCTARVAAGKTCKLGDQCVAGYTCYRAASTKDGGAALECNKTPTFIPGATKGASCGYDKSTKKTVTCEQGLSCNLTTGVCVTTVKLGGACTDGASECELYTACDPTTKKCAQFPGAGGDCGYSSGQDVIGCLGQTYCKPSATNALVGSCADKEASGAACAADEQCASGHCTKKSKDAGTGTCSAPCTEE
jgi:hypothetical protein